MPRIPRSYIKTSYFHVITQGLNKSYIFNKPEDIKYYIKLLYEAKKDYNIKIIAYCIMHNHAHILIKTDHIKELSNYMHKVNTKYGIYYNKKYNRVGYVFRDRYKAEGIYSEKHLYCCIKYIYDNPVKAGICKFAKDYPFSNYRLLPDIIDDEFCFIDSDEDKEIIYKQVIKNFLDKNTIDLSDLKKNKRLLKELINILVINYNVSFRTIAKELKISRDRVRNNLYK